MIRERFEIGRRLGHGAMGAVYEAFDRERGRPVAIKLYRHDDVVTLARVRRIVDRLRGWHHLNVVEVIELIEDGDAPVLVMERIDGEDLMSYVAGRWRSEPAAAPASRPVRCDLRRLRACLVQLAAGLVALHDHDVLHRDLKPANLLVTAEGRLVILDFSLSDDRGGDPEGGSIGYMAPEQAMTGGTLAPAADWYAVGVIAYEALTGRLPFVGLPQRVLQDKARTAPPTVDTLVSDAPADLVALCRDLLVPDPAERPSRDELVRRIGLVQPSAPQAAAPPPRRRARAVETVIEALQDARAAGRAGLIALTAELGLGRTTTLREVTEAVVATWPDAIVLSLDGRGDLLDQLGEALAAELAVLPADERRALVPHGAAALCVLLRALGSIPGFERAAIASPAPLAHVQLTDAIDALRELLTLWARRRPLVLVIDDLDHADDDARTVLADSLRGPDPPPLFFVGAAVAAADLPAIQGLSPQSLAWSSRSEIDALLAARGVSAEARPVIVDRSEGNPSLAIELARAHALDEPIPDGDLVAVMRARVARLPPSSRRVLVALELAGRTVAPEVVARALDLDDASRDTVFAELEQAGLILGPRRATPAAVHAVIASMPRGEVAEVARALALGGTNLPAAIQARLWQRAGDPGRAGADAQRAAEHARARLRFAAAVIMYRLAIDEGRTTLEGALAESAAAAGQGGVAARAYAAAASQPGIDAATRLELSIRAAEHHLLAGEVDDGIDGYRRALASVEIGLASTPRRALPRLLMRRAWQRVRGVGFDRRRSVEIAPFELARVDACFSASSHLIVLENVIGAELQSRALTIALRVGEPERLGQAAVAEAVFLITQGAVARAEQLLGIARQIADDLGSAPLSSFVQLGQGALEYMHHNRFDAALATFDGALRHVLPEASAATWVIDLAQTYAAFALMYLGDIHELARRVHAQVRESERRGDRYAATILRVRCNVAWLARGDLAGADAALAIAEHAWPFAGPRFRVPDYYRMYAQVERALWTGDAEAARRTLDAGLGALERSMLTRVGTVRAEVDALAGRVAIAGAATGQARAAARIWVRRLRRNHLPIGPMWAALLAGCAALRDGEHAEAAASLTEAVARADDLSLGLHAAAGRLRLGEATATREPLERAHHDLARLGATDVPRTTALIAPR